MKLLNNKDEKCNEDTYLPGIQLYSVRDEFGDRALSTLKVLSDMGYRTVEFAGYDGIPALKMHSYLQRLGFKAPASHVSLEKLEGNLEGEIEYAKTVGIHYLVIPMIEKEVFFNRDEYEKVVNSLRVIGEKVKEHQMQLVYHNHDHEFERLPNGTLILDQLLLDVGTDVLQLELDLFWVYKAGFDLVATIMKYKGHVPLIHMKDMDHSGNSTELGKGVIDYRPLFAMLANVGVHYTFVEQEHFDRPSLESAKVSLEYLRSFK
ncbi:sugar phosphate isomerase/epimerase [Alkalihalobacillus sp. MEB130]|uniref:sugar phosphate isomerase/epimerase family protein n=1 Tax=Alkalihalobacillus sp. MEB130 TaxID=2976704 RepID=UPI0028DD53D5|nr:sugar phosphate isomerase/epimerase [Alkalihalobacillus sp. MEB130]MDT8858850.1 sugar phosphate isomerase/epimerase [Alkalihalobacillus sp. MEB130]